MVCEHEAWVREEWREALETGGRNEATPIR